MSRAPPRASISARSVRRRRGEATAIGYRPTHNAIYLYHATLRQTGWLSLVRLLSVEERHRADAFAFERDARRFMVSHAILRTLLGDAIGIPPGELSFRREPGLKPVLEVRLGRPLHFSPFAIGGTGSDRTCLAPARRRHRVAGQDRRHRSHK
jgi:hypothetical protein